MHEFGAIFDMDGVLVDSREAHWRAFTRLADEEGTAFPDALFRDVFGQANPEIFRRWLGAGLAPARVAALDRRKEQIYREIARPCLEAVPGVDALLGRLASSGFRLAVGSSGPRENVEMVLDRFGWRDTFAAATTKDDVAAGKPDPAIFLLAAGRLDLPPKCCVVVEDSVAGVEAAARAGMPCVAITSTSGREELAAADAVIDSFDETGPPLFRALLEQRAERRDLLSDNALGVLFRSLGAPSEAVPDLVRQIHKRAEQLAAEEGVTPGQALRRLLSLFADRSDSPHPS